MRAKTQKNKSQEWTVCLEDTPMGSLLLTFTANGLAALDFAGRGRANCRRGPLPHRTLSPMIEAVKKALTKYFVAGAHGFRCPAPGPPGHALPTKGLAGIAAHPPGPHHLL